MEQQYHDARTRPNIIPPEGGWEAHTWYVVDVEVFATNPRHRALFFSGFLQGGQPGSYNGVQALNFAGGEDAIPLHRVKYLRVVRRLISEQEAQDL
jgi:hypothetical protein